MHHVLATLVATAVLGSAPDEPVRQPDTARFRFTGDLGFVSTAGNRESTTLNAGEKVRWRIGILTLSQGFNVITGRTDGEESANLWRFDIRADEALGARVGLYQLVAWDRNPLAGLRSRYEEGVGGFWKPVASPRQRLTLEVGFGLIQQQNTDAPDDHFPVSRFAAEYRLEFAEKAFLYDKLEVLPNLEDGNDLRINHELGAAAPVTKGVALRVSHLVRFDNEPEPGFEKTDRFLTAGVQVTF